MSEDEGSLQQLKSEWQDTLEKLGLTKEIDNGHCHPYSDINFAHSQHVMLSALQNMRHSLQFFQKISDEQKSAASSASSLTTPSLIPQSVSPPDASSAFTSPTAPSTGPATTSGTTSTTTTPNQQADLRIYFKQWKDHKKTVMQRAYLSETLEQATTLLGDYCQQKLHTSNTPYENRNVKIIQILKRIVRKMTRLELAAFANMKDEKKLKAQMFQFYPYSDQGLQYYTIANSNYNLDVVLDSNSYFHSVSLVHLAVDEQTENLPSDLAMEIKEQHDSINKDLFEMLKAGNYEAFEEKLILLFQQKNILQNLPKCVVTLPTAKDSTSLQVFDHFDQLLWKSIRPSELQMVSALAPEEQQKELIFNLHGIMDRKCDGISMSYYQSQNGLFHSATVCMEEYSADSTCPVLRLYPSVCLPFYIAQQISQATFAEMPEYTVCRCNSNIELGSLLLTEAGVLPQNSIILGDSNYTFYAEDSSATKMLSAIVVSRFPFTSITQILPIFQTLRKQLRFNELYLSCFTKREENAMVDGYAGDCPVEVSVLPPLSIVLRLLDSSASTFHSVEVETVSATESKVFVYDISNKKTLHEEASQHVNNSCNLPALIQYLLHSK